MLRKTQIVKVSSNGSDKLRMNKLGAILFDVDGTLADTEELHRQAFNITFAESGLAWHWSKPQYAQLLSISGGPDRIRHYARTQAPDSRLEQDPRPFIQALHVAKSATFRRLLAQTGAPLRPGVRRLLDDARRHGVQLALATCTSMANVRQLLDQNLPSDWPSWFATIVTSADLQEMKPSPDVYLQVLSRLQLPARACVAVEDTVNGNKAACAAGLATVITTNEFTYQSAFPGARLVVSQLGEPKCPFELLSGSPASQQTYVDLGMLGDLIDGDLPRASGQPAPNCRTSGPQTNAMVG
jgi:HAD superfamily hydrolase (TIGR01509 family)